MLQKIKNLSTTIKMLILILIAGLVVCGVVLYMNQEPPRDIRSLSEADMSFFEPLTEAESVELCWGAAQIIITDKSQIDDIIHTLMTLQVTEFIKETDYRHDIDNTSAAVRIHFPVQDRHIYSTVDYQNAIVFSPIGESWLITNPDILQGLFQNYCTEMRDSLADTTHYADLDNDGADEIIVVNPQDEKFHFTIYRADGIMLYDAWMNTKYSHHGDFYLCEKDGEYYLLEFNLDRMDDRFWYFDWYLRQFDEKGGIIEMDYNHQSIARTEDDYRYGSYRFDLDELKLFFHELDDLLQHSMLLLSTEDGQMLYSTKDKLMQMTVDDYMDYWYDAIPVLQPISREAWMDMNMDERLECCEYYLRADSQKKHAKGWAESYVNNDGEARHQLMTDDLWKATTKVNQTEERESWMPILEGLTIHREEDNNNLYLGNESEFHYALKDDGLTVKDYSVEQATDENGAIVENTFRILYEIAEDSGKQYTYIEQIVFERGENWPDWLVTECESSYQK
ncbi:MAG: hypothetical protein IJO07_00420 [Peptococcaceae bacterium]|nr:hypothetical protein [Peptococcaceae bacterium]